MHKIFFYTYIIILTWASVNPQSVIAQTIPPGKIVQKNKIRQSEKLEKLSPGGNQYSPVEIQQIHQSLENTFRPEKHQKTNQNQWEILGPSGIFSSDGSNFVCSGRVRDIEVLEDNHIRVATASGGLWDIIKNPARQTSYIPISTRDVPSIWNGVVATDPFNKNVILLGTGEPAIRGGAGLWRSSDSGLSWTMIPINGSVGMGAFDEMEFTKIPGKVWCSGSDGVFFSEDSGNSWTQKRSGNFPGMVVYPYHPDTVLISEYGRGIFRTRDGGKTWQKCVNGLPSQGFYRVELANCLSHPDVIYALFTKNDHTTLGIYKSVNGGDSWSRCTVFNAFGEADVDYHWGLGWYCSFISVSPTNPNHVFSGGGWYVFSEDGQNFFGPTQGQHPDFHCGGWSRDGKTLWTGNDGGVYSTAFDNKWIWDKSTNDLPVTQFVSVSVSRSQPDVIIGGTQDNGLVYYSATANKWFYFFGDGGGAAIDPDDAQILYGTIGVSGPPLTFNNVRKIGPSTGGWQTINEGIKPSGQWWRLIRTDYNSPATLYTQADNEIYYSFNQGQFWHHLNVQKLPMAEISSMKISTGEYPKIYVSGPGPDKTSLMRLDMSTWDWKNITQGLPTKYNQPGGISIPHVFVSENSQFPERVYVVMRGYGSHIKNKVIFKSDDCGDSWENISGNLPDLPFTVLLEHPENENIIIAGTDGFGIFITLDGGKNWSIWAEGLPKGAFITDIDFQKFSPDSVYVVISTYGASIFRRLLPNDNFVNTREVPKQNRKNHILSAEYKEQKLDVRISDINPTGKVLRCFSMDGKCIFEKKLTGMDYDMISVQLPEMTPGLYLVHLSDHVSLWGVKKFLAP